MNVENMTKKQLLEIPERESFSSEVIMRSLIIVPGGYRDIHDSGYRLMNFIAVSDKGVPICKLSGCSDVLHIGGIMASQKKSESWSIDCLHKSGLLRLFCGKHISAGAALSSFSIEVVEK